MGDNLIDGIDGDEFEDDDPGDDRCPICESSQQDGECGHLVLSVDGEMGPIGGVLYREWGAIVDSAKRIVFNALVGRLVGRDSTGGGEGLDELRKEIAREFDWRDHLTEPEDEDADPDPEEAYPFFDDAWSSEQWDLRATKILERELDSTPGVISTRYEFSTAPLMTWWGRSYWASEPQDAVNEFRVRTRAWSRPSDEL